MVHRVAKKCDSAHTRTLFSTPTAAALVHEASRESLFKKIFMYLFTAALGLCCGIQTPLCCVWVFLGAPSVATARSSCSAQASHRSGFSGCRAEGAWASVVVAQGLSCPTAYGISVPGAGIGRLILNWTTRRVPLTVPFDAPTLVTDQF